MADIFHKNHQFLLDYQTNKQNNIAIGNVRLLIFISNIEYKKTLTFFLSQKISVQWKGTMQLRLLTAL